MNSTAQGAVTAPSSLSDSTAVLLATAFAVQRLIEILDPWVFPTSPNAMAWRRWVTQRKAAFSGVFATLAGLIVSWVGGVRILPSGLAADWANIAVTALAIGAGTNGVNSVLKFAQYSKEARSDEAKLMPATPLSPPVTAAEARARSLRI